MSLSGVLRVSSLFVAIGLSAAPAVDVTVDLATTYQTIDGFGAMHDVTPWKIKDGPFYIDANVNGFLDSLVTVQGFTLYRVFIEGCEMSPSPGVYRIPASMRHYYGTTVKRMKQTADARGEPLRIVPAILSPPGYMKVNGVCPGTFEGTYGGASEPNQLKPESYAEFGDFCAWYLKTVRDTFGITCYAFSPQNEPNFNEPYSSCSYADGAHYARMLKVVGPRIRAASPTTLIYGAEHMAWAYPSWENAVLADAGARDYIDRFAIHGYSDGIRVDTASFGTIRPESGRPLWMSETGGTYADYSTAFGHANTVLNCLVRSSMSAWIFVGIAGANNGVPDPQYWMYCHINRFVRPDMKRVKVTCSDSELLIGAFKDDAKLSRSLVIINNANATRSVSIRFTGGTAPQSFAKRSSTSAAYYVADGSVSATSTIAVAARSVVSLGENHEGSVSVTPPRAAVLSRAPHAGATRNALYDLRGRRAAQGMGARAGCASGAIWVLQGHNSAEVRLTPVNP